MIMMSPEVKDLDVLNDDPSYIPSYKASVTLDYQLPRLPPGTLLFPRDWMNIKNRHQTAQEFTSSDIFSN